MDNAYFLVTWIYETPVRNSVMSQVDIVEADIRSLNPKELIGKEVEFKWKGKRTCTGKVISNGTNTAMKLQLKPRAKNAPSVSTVKRSTETPGKPIKRKANDQAESAEAKKQQIQDVLSALPVETTEEDALNKRIRAMEDELSALKKRNAELESEIKQLRDNRTADEQAIVDIGNGVMIPKPTISAFRTVSSGVNVYGRNLFRHLFSQDEVIGYSLMGKACNATTKIAQPAIDTKRRDAIVDHSLKAFGILPGNNLYALTKKDLKKSLSSLMQEIIRDFNKQHAELIQEVEGPLND